MTCNDCGRTWEEPGAPPPLACPFCGVSMVASPVNFPLRIAIAFIPSVLILAYPTTVSTLHPSAKPEIMLIPTVLLALATPVYLFLRARSWREKRLGPAIPGKEFERGCGTVALAFGMTAANLFVVFAGCVAALTVLG